MSNLIQFPSKDQTPVVEREQAEEEHLTLSSFVLSQKEDQAFRKLLFEWPCFQELDISTSLAQVFESYYDDELTLAQDCVIEFLSHMHDPDSVFDISNALYTWSEEDREFFFISLNMHAELLDRIKQEEL